jgi:hypothetical protein
MTAIVQQYIQYIAWPDTQPKAVKIADRKFSNVVMPDKYTYAFYFFELVEETVEIRGEAVELTSVHRDESPVYFYGAKAYTPAVYRKEKPAENWKEVLEYVTQMRWKKFMILRTGEPLPYEDDTIIVVESN